MAKTRLEILKEKYSFHTDNRKYFIPGGEILKYIGMDVALRKKGAAPASSRGCHRLSCADFP